VIGNQEPEVVEHLHVDCLWYGIEVPFFNLAQHELDVPTVRHAGVCVGILRDDMVVEGEDVFHRRIPQRVSHSLVHRNRLV
jgi:hypothetical protein